MRKLILVITSLLLMSTDLIFAAPGKLTEYTTIRNIWAKVEFNVGIGYNLQQEMEYVPMRIIMYGIADDSLGGKRRIKVVEDVGDASTTPYEGKVLYNNVPALVKGMLKDLYLEAIDEDLDQ